MKRLFALATVFIVLFSLPLSAQVKRLSREAIDSIKNRKLLDGGNSVLKFDFVSNDIGTMYESDAAKKVVFPFVNISHDKVTITEITTNCGCTSSSCSKYELQPGEAGEISVYFNPKGRSGTVDTNIFVYSSLSDRMPVAKLTLLGNVVDMNEWRHLPLLIGGSLRLKHRSVTFEPVKPGTLPQMRIPCANVGKTSMQLFSRLKPDFIEFATEPTVISPGEEGDLVISVAGDKLPQNIGNSYSLLLEGVGGRVSDRMIEINIENNKE